MATHNEHADAIKAAIEAALNEGFRLEFDLIHGGGWEGEIEKIDLDIWDDREWLTVFTEDLS